jgi:hypothetical protein
LTIGKAMARRLQCSNNPIPYSVQRPILQDFSSALRPLVCVYQSAATVPVGSNVLAIGVSSFPQCCSIPWLTGVKLGLVSYTVAAFSLVTINTAMNLDI